MIKRLKKNINSIICKIELEIHKRQRKLYARRLLNTCNSILEENYGRK